MLENLKEQHNFTTFIWSAYIQRRPWHEKKFQLVFFRFLLTNTVQRSKASCDILLGSLRPNSHKPSAGWQEMFCNTRRTQEREFAQKKLKSERGNSTEGITKKTTNFTSFTSFHHFIPPYKGLQPIYKQMSISNYQIEINILLNFFSI